MAPIRLLRDAAFLLVVMLGGLLSMVSIVVVLDLRDPVAVPDEVSASRLRASLDSAALRAEAAQPLAVTLPLDSTYAVSAAADTTAYGRLFRAQRALLDGWAGHRSALLAGNRAAAADAVLDYGTEMGRPGGRDRVRRFLVVKRWHQDHVERVGNHLDSVRAALGRVNAELLALRDVRDPAAAARAAELARARWTEAHELLSRSPGRDTIPTRTDPALLARRDSSGFPWIEAHPFAALSAWLRTQGSLELVTVMGMLGFGLLGAAASTVVRRGKAGVKAEGAPLGSNLTDLVLSGTSAALATYLLVKGGLAVVSAETAEPNPYLLLLTCFVAAVYWEHAWERVRKAVSGEKPGEGEPGRAAAPAAPAPAAAPAPDRAPVAVPGGRIVSDADVQAPAPADAPA